MRSMPMALNRRISSPIDALALVIGRSPTISSPIEHADDDRRVVLVQSAKRFGQPLEIARDDRVGGRVQLDAAQRRAEAAYQLVRQLRACRCVDHDCTALMAARTPRGPECAAVCSTLLRLGRADLPQGRRDRAPQLRGAERCPPFAGVERVLQQIHRVFGLQRAERFDGLQIDGAERALAIEVPDDVLEERNGALAPHGDQRRGEHFARLSRCRWPARAAARHTPRPCRSRESRAPPRAARAARCRRAGVVRSGSASEPPNSRSRWIAVRRTAGLADARSCSTAVFPAAPKPRRICVNRWRATARFSLASASARPLTIDGPTM